MWLLLRLWGLSLLRLSITDFLLEIARTLPFNSAEYMDGLADIKKHWKEDCASHVLTLFMQWAFAEGPLRAHDTVWLSVSYLLKDNETRCSFFLWVNKPPPFRQCAVHHDLKISGWINKHLLWRFYRKSSYICISSHCCSLRNSMYRTHTPRLG